MVLLHVLCPVYLTYYINHGNSSRTRRSPNRSKEENQSKEMDKEIKTTMIREMREEIKTLRKELAAVREENGELRK
jgi:transposase-like protein